MHKLCINMKKPQDKTERQRLILTIITEHRIATQTELRDALREHGIACDQATVSRDIRELGLVRVADADGNTFYASLETAAPKRSGRIEILRQFLRSVQWSGNLLVIHTDSANAHPVAEALDTLGFTEILGTVAGDNTIIAVVKEGTNAQALAERILKEAGKL